MNSALNFKEQILLAMFIQVVNKILRMNGFISLGSLTEMPQHFRLAKC